MQEISSYQLFASYLGKDSLHQYNLLLTASSNLKIFENDCQ